MTLSQDLIREWLAAAGNAPIAAELEGVYEYVAAQVESRGPACWASGRCCNFEKTGHLLYVTGLEAAYTLARLGQEHKPLVGRAGAVCPFLSSNLCGVHAIRPLGCRVYFCDRATQDWQRDLSERAITQVRSIHDRHAVEYRYGEWRAMLAAFQRPGLLRGV